MATSLINFHECIKVNYRCMFLQSKMLIFFLKENNVVVFY